MKRLASSIGFVFIVMLSGFIAFAQPCDARIVYTPANVVLVNSGNIPIDFDNSGIADVTINQVFKYNGCLYAYAAADPANGNSDVSGVSGLDGPWAAALGLGAFIGNNQPYSNGFAVLVDDYGGPGCPFGHAYGFWNDAKAHYLGVQFLENGKVHFGWAQLTVSISNSHFSHKMTTTLSGYAYETVVGKAIPAGKT
jgi:hypothetical protein